MGSPEALNILALNSGSSSLKFALYRMDGAETLLWSGRLDGIGRDGGSRLRVMKADAGVLRDQSLAVPDHAAAITVFFEWFRRQDGVDIDAVGHRIVYGGERYWDPQPITAEMEAYLQRFISRAPEHMPQAITVIRAVRSVLPDICQFACFDTAFHRYMPKVARMYPLPRSYFDEGIVRFGFHGLSYAYVMQELARMAGQKAAPGRIIVAHLGSGASMAAIRDGQALDTTMGLTPMGGLMMSTRPGDLDPGVLLYLLKDKGLSPVAVEELLSHRSGLLGVSGVSPDMRDLLAVEKTNPDAAEAIALFCYLARKLLGSLTAVLGGLDTLVFTGGIGENSATIRQRLCDGLEFLGISLDPMRNTEDAAVISSDQSRVTVRIIETNEEWVIARAGAQLRRKPS